MSLLFIAVWSHESSANLEPNHTNLQERKFMDFVTHFAIWQHHIYKYQLEDYSNHSEHNK